MNCDNLSWSKQWANVGRDFSEQNFMSVNAFIKEDFLARECGLGRGPFVLNGNAEGKEISKHAIRRTDFLRKAHLRFQRRKLVDGFSDLNSLGLYWWRPCCHGFNSSSLQLLWVTFANLSFLRSSTSSAAARTFVLVCTEVYGRLRGTDRCGAGWRCCYRPLQTLCPLRSPVAQRAHSPPCVTYCRTQHSAQIFRIFSEILKIPVAYLQKRIVMELFLSNG